MKKFFVCLMLIGCSGTDITVPPPDAGDCECLTTNNNSIISCVQQGNCRASNQCVLVHPYVSASYCKLE